MSSRANRSTQRSPDNAGLSMLAMGLAHNEELAYRTLLRHPGITAEALRAHMGSSCDDPALLLESLLARGLLSKVPDGGGLIATAPEAAIELLLMERQSELNRARQILPELQADLLRGAGSADALEALDALNARIVPADANAWLQAYLQVHDTARVELATVLCPPFIASAPDAMSAARAAGRQRGVRYRTLIPPQLLHLDSWRTAVEQATASGEQLRVLADLPFKMLLADRSCALVPLRTEDPTGPALKLGRTTVVDALWMVFEQLWQQAVPALEVTAQQFGADVEEPGDAQLRMLVTLLAAGRNDKTIAGVLGISERTLQRRINALHVALNARSRFHCGWLAARSFGDGS